MRASLPSDDSTGCWDTVRERINPVRASAELEAMRTASFSYLARHLEQLERLLIELPEGSLTADELQTLRDVVKELKQSTS